MNDLNTQQVILLALLVAFVTSIATGITVVSLMQQSTQPVTQTINRVVEKTVERIVEEPEKEGDKPVERIVETVVVNQEDLTVDAVSKNIKSIARIYREIPGVQNEFRGIGVIVSSDGKILTDASVNSIPGTFIAVVQGETYRLKEGRSESGFSIMQINNAPEGKTFSQASFADSSSVQLAQSVILLSGTSQDSVATGIINNINKNESGSEREFITSIGSSSVITGSVLLNLKGEIVGVRADGSLSTPSAFTPSNIAKSFLNSATAQ